MVAFRQVSLQKVCMQFSSSSELPCLDYLNFLDLTTLTIIDGLHNSQVSCSNIKYSVFKFYTNTHLSFP